MSAILNFKKWEKLYEQQAKAEGITLNLSPVIVEWQKAGKPANAHTVFYNANLPININKGDGEDKLFDLRGGMMSFMEGIDPLVKDAIEKAITGINANSENDAAAKTLATAANAGTFISIPNNAGNAVASSLKWMPTNASGLTWNLVPLTDADKSKFSLT